MKISDDIRLKTEEFILEVIEDGKIKDVYKDSEKVETLDEDEKEMLETLLEIEKFLNNS